MTDQNRQETRETENQDYIGNIWGWKFSLVGLIVLLIFVSIMIYGYQFKQDAVPNNAEPETPTQKLEGYYKIPQEINYDIRIS